MYNWLQRSLNTFSFIVGGTESNLHEVSLSVCMYVVRFRTTFAARPYFSEDQRSVLFVWLNEIIDLYVGSVGIYFPWHQCISEI